jgi:hypothetical protein
MAWYNLLNIFLPIYFLAFLALIDGDLISMDAFPEVKCVGGIDNEGSVHFGKLATNKRNITSSRVTVVIVSGSAMFSRIAPPCLSVDVDVSGPQAPAQGPG